MLKVSARCKSCGLFFNKTNRAPISVPCGHTICNICLNKCNQGVLIDNKFTCPIDPKHQIL